MVLAQENLSSESHSSRSAAVITALHGYHDHQQKLFHCLNVGIFLARWPFAIYTTTSLSYLFSSYSHHPTSQTIPSFPSVPPACKSIVPKPIAHSRYLSHHILLIFFSSNPLLILHATIPTAIHPRTHPPFIIPIFSPPFLSHTHISNIPVTTRFSL